MTAKYCLDSGEVVTRDELRKRLAAELDAMEPETRAANCDGTIDDLIADSVVTGVFTRMGHEITLGQHRTRRDRLQRPTRRSVTAPPMTCLCNR